MANQPKREKFQEPAPSEFPVTKPQFAQPGHDFTLQAVIEMQRSIGELSAKTDRLISDVKSQGDKIDKVRILISRLGGGAAVVLFITAVVLAIVRYLPLGTLAK